MGETLSLLFQTRSDGTYSIRVKESWSGRVVDGNFSPPYTSKQTNALQKKLNAFESHDNELREIGYQLFSALCGMPTDSPFPPLQPSPAPLTVQSVLVGVIQRTLKRRGTVALTLIFGQGCEAFIRYPWELLHNGDHFLLVSGVFTLTRALLRPDATGGCELPVHPPFRILYISSSPANLVPLETERSFEAMEQALAPLVDRGQVFLDRLEPPTFSQFVHYLSSYGGASMLDDSDTILPCYVVHFDGHGAYGKLCPRDGCETINSSDARKCSVCETSLARVQAQTYLCFCDDEGQNCFIDTQSLRGLLLSSDVRLAVFSACETATIDDVPANQPHRFSSQQLSVVDAMLATALITAQVPAVVAMPFSLQDDLSPTFMYHFYDALAEGKTLEEALARSRQAMLPMQQRSWFIPVLYRQVVEDDENPTPLITLDDNADQRQQPLSQLGPADTFIGRERELHDLDALLTNAALGQQNQRQRTPTSASNARFCRIALTGSPGIGKSALALETIRRNRGKFQGGVIGVSLQDEKSFYDALAEVIVQLRIPVRNLTALDSKQRSRLIQGTLRSLANRELPSLFLVDGFEEVKERQELELWLQFLDSLPGEVVVLVTSRSNPEPTMALGGAHYRWYEYRVGKMTDDDLLHLFSDLAASSGLDQRIHLDDPPQQAILREICTLLDGYPLGAALIFGTARSIGGKIYTPEAASRSLEEIRDELRHTPLAGILAVLDVSYGRLSSSARLLLSYLAAFRLPFSREQIELLVSPDTISAMQRAEQLVKDSNDDVVENTATSLSATLVPQWRSARDELVQKSFLQFDGRLYSIHSQIRHFALSHLPHEERRRVNRHVAAYYYTLPQPVPEEWFAAFELLETAGESQDLREALRIVPLMAEALSGCGYTVRLLTILRRAIRYATRLNDQNSLNQAQYWLGVVLHKVGQYTEAEACLQGCLTYYQQMLDDEHIALVQVALSILFVSEGDYDRSLSYAEKTLALCQQQSDTKGITKAELAVADAQYYLSHFSQALRHVELALLNCYHQPDQPDQVSRGWALCIRGRIYEAMGQYSRAIRDQEDAIRLFHDLKRLGDQAWARFYKASVYLRQNRFEQAEQLCRELLSRFREYGSLAGEACTLRLLGNLCVCQQKPINAQPYYEEALTLFNQLGNHVEEAVIFCSLGDRAYAEQQYLDAREYYERAFAITQEYNALRVRGLALRGLGDVSLMLQQQQEAVHYYRDALDIFMQLALPGEQALLLERQGQLQESLHRYQEAMQTWVDALQVAKQQPLLQQQRLRKRIEALVAEQHLEKEYQACLKGDGSEDRKTSL